MSRKRLVTHDEAEPTLRQHVKPCSDCPFLKDCPPGWLGGGHPDEWVSDAHGDAVMQCHTRTSTNGTPWQCAGAATYRANVGKMPRSAEALRLPKSEAVFANREEFLEHHGDGP